MSNLLDLYYTLPNAKRIKLYQKNIGSLGKGKKATTYDKLVNEFDEEELRALHGMSKGRAGAVNSVVNAIYEDSADKIDKEYKRYDTISAEAQDFAKANKTYKKAMNILKGITAKAPAIKIKKPKKPKTLQEKINKNQSEVGEDGEIMTRPVQSDNREDGSYEKAKQTDLAKKIAKERAKLRYMELIQTVDGKPVPHSVITKYRNEVLVPLLHQRNSKYSEKKYRIRERKDHDNLDFERLKHDKFYHFEDGDRTVSRTARKRFNDFIFGVKKEDMPTELPDNVNLRGISLV